MSPFYVLQRQIDQIPGDPINIGPISIHTLDKNKSNKERIRPIFLCEYCPIGSSICLWIIVLGSIWLGILQYRISFYVIIIRICLEPRYFLGYIIHPDFISNNYYVFLFNAINFLNFSSTSAWNRTTFSKCSRFGQCNQWKWFRNVSIPWWFYDKIIWHFAIMK